MPLTQTRMGPLELARSLNAEWYRQAQQRGMSLTQLMEQPDNDPSEDYSPEDTGYGLSALARAMQAAGMVTEYDARTGFRPITYEEAVSPDKDRGIPASGKRALLLEWGMQMWRRATREMRREQMELFDKGWDQMSPAQRAILLSGDAAAGSLVNAYYDDTTIRAKRLLPPIPLDRLVARRTRIDREAYRSLYIVDDVNTDAYRFKRVTEGADIPTTTVVSGEHLKRLSKHGRAILTTYEQLRRQTLDRIAFLLQRIALQAEVDKALDATNTIVNGDGNANTAATVVALTTEDSGASAGTLTLKGYIGFELDFPPAYSADVVLGQKASILQLLLLPFNTVNGIPLGNLAAGQMLGQLRPIRDQISQGMSYGVTPDAPALKLVMFDSSITLEMVEEIGGDIAEVERFITNQTQIMTMTEMVGFAILDPYSSRILNINA